MLLMQLQLGGNYLYFPSTICCYSRDIDEHTRKHRRRLDLASVCVGNGQRRRRLQ